MNAITVCVDYDDLLSITLPRNAKHFERILVVTSFKDLRTQRVVAAVPNARVFLTDAFYRHGASFNKGLAIEEALNVIGRRGWLCMIDADIVLPATLPLPLLDCTKLYSPWRRNLIDAAKFADDLDWNTLPRADDRELAGYFHLLHADSPVLSTIPWYATNWKHAGGYDSALVSKWPQADQYRLPFDVLHLGEDGINWHGRTNARMDGSAPAHCAEHKIAQEAMWRHRRRHKNKRNELL